MSRLFGWFFCLNIVHFVLGDPFQPKLHLKRWSSIRWQHVVTSLSNNINISLLSLNSTTFKKSFETEIKDNAKWFQQIFNSFIFQGSVSESFFVLKTSSREMKTFTSSTRRNKNALNELLREITKRLKYFVVLFPLKRCINKHKAIPAETINKFFNRPTLSNGFFMTYLIGFLAFISLLRFLSN